MSSPVVFARGVARRLRDLVPQPCGRHAVCDLRLDDWERDRLAELLDAIDQLIAAPPAPEAERVEAARCESDGGTNAVWDCCPTCKRMFRRGSEPPVCTGPAGPQDCCSPAPSADDGFEQKCPTCPNADTDPQGFCAACGNHTGIPGDYRVSDSAAPKGRTIRRARMEAADVRVEELPRLVEALCADLNEAHRELMKAQGVENPEAYDWPEWSGPANSLRWAEQLLGKRLGRSRTTQHEPAPSSTPEPAERVECEPKCSVCGCLAHPYTRCCNYSCDCANPAALKAALARIEDKLQGGDAPSGPTRTSSSASRVIDGAPAASVAGAAPSRVEAADVPAHHHRYVVPHIYAAQYAKMHARARELGYALAVHGSLVRDCDVIAVPWTEVAVPADELSAALAATIGAELSRNENGEAVTIVPNERPHGRRCWSLILLGGDSYIDLAVMPRSPAPSWAADVPPMMEREIVAMQSTTAWGDSIAREQHEQTLARAEVAESDNLAAMKAAYALTLDCQTAEEAVTDLVRIAREAREQRDAAEAALATAHAEQRAADVAWLRSYADSRRVDPMDAECLNETASELEREPLARSTASPVEPAEKQEPVGHWEWMPASCVVPRCRMFVGHDPHRVAEKQPLYASPVAESPVVATWRVERHSNQSPIWSLHTADGGNANVYPNGSLACELLALIPDGSDSAEFELRLVKP